MLPRLLIRVLGTVLSCTSVALDGLCLSLSILSLEQLWKPKIAERGAAKRDMPALPFSAAPSHCLPRRLRSIKCLLYHLTGVRATEDESKLPGAVAQAAPSNPGVRVPAEASAAMPINRCLSGFISVQRLSWLLSSARAQGAGSWVNNTLFSRKFHSIGACFRRSLI